MTNALPEIRIGADGPEAVAASPEMLADLLATLESEVARAGVPVGQWLSPPATESDLKAALAESGLLLSAELAILYTWHDGALPGGHAALPRFPFEPYLVSLDRYRIRRANDEQFEDQLGFGGWGDPAGWLPLVADSFTRVVDCTDPDGRPPLVRSTEPDFAGQRPLAQGRSLCTLVTWWIEGIRSGAHTWQADRRIWLLDEVKLPALQREYRLA